MKAAIFLAEGFEEVEAVTVIDYLRRAGIGIDIYSIEEDKYEVTGAHQIKVRADYLLKNFEYNYQAIILPGGMPGALYLKESNKVKDILEMFYHREHLIAAICAAPIVLEEAGILKYHYFTCYPGFEKNMKLANYKNLPVVIDKNIITAQGPACAELFAYAIIGKLLGSDSVEKIQRETLFKECCNEQ